MIVLVFWYVSNMLPEQKTQLPPITFNHSLLNTHICSLKHKKCLRHLVIGRSLHIYQHVVHPSNIELGKKHYTLKSQTCMYLVNHLWKYLNAHITTLIEILNEWWTKFIGSQTTEKLLVISFVVTFIVVVAINAWLEAYGLALTLIATNKVSQRLTPSTLLIIRRMKVIDSHLYTNDFFDDDKIIFHLT